MKHYPLADTESNYRSVPAISQSDLKLILESIDIWNDKKNNASKSQKAGSLVDVYITGGQAVFDALYYQTKFNCKFSDTITAIIDYVISKLIEYNINKITLLDDELYELGWNACDSVSYYMNRRKNDYISDTRFRDILNKDSSIIDYINERISNVGKIAYNKDDLLMLKAIKTSIITSKDPVIASIFDDEDDSDVHFQMCIFDTVNGIYVKGMLDIVVIDHKFAKIYLIDLKTTSDYKHNFPQSILKYRYDFQLAFYKHLLSKKYPLYQIECSNLVVSFKNPSQVVRFVYDDDLVAQGDGGITKPFKWIEGWQDAIAKYKYHIKVNDYSKSYEELINNGVITLTTTGYATRYKQTFN